MFLKKPAKKTVYDLMVDPASPECLVEFLKWFLAPAVTRNSLMTQLGKQVPLLYATYEGKRVKCLMASRFDDIGINEDLNVSGGYTLRVNVGQLTNFSTTP